MYVISPTLCMYIYPLSRIHNTSFVSAYFGLNKHEYGCLEYLFIIIQCYIHTYHSHIIPEGLAETLQTFLSNTHISPKLKFNQI
jgi:hypothetical protein